MTIPRCVSFLRLSKQTGGLKQHSISQVRSLVVSTGAAARCLGLGSGLPLDALGENLLPCLFRFSAEQFLVVVGLRTELPVPSMAVRREPLLSNLKSPAFLVMLPPSSSNSLESFSHFSSLRLAFLLLRFCFQPEQVLCF